MRAIHPGGVLPHGNALVVSPEDARARRDRRRDGLGTLAALDDATLLDVCDKLSRDLEGARARASRESVQSVSSVRDARRRVESGDADGAWRTVSVVLERAVGGRLREDAASREETRARGGGGGSGKGGGDTDADI